ncbi:regulator of G-protein signaling 14a [Chanos chanos]|uniref:Regulator of G-protein signaling 14a n=1 Tax=Chanos chanos TaxID=29144 RepID=A0A6J2UN25_CHACN|nr:regulator of G-protein signaling 14-like [Chanos chanos]
MPNKMKTLGVPQGLMTQAVSDGELNMCKVSGGGSSHSLTGSSSVAGGQEGNGPASRVVSWAVCFERLLEDPVGVRYFTAFLKSEVSAENILFWQACEKFRQIPPTKLDELKREARTIYDTYLSDSSFHAVNIDDTARTEESDLEKPTPNMFHKAQEQIFKLMKFDSYSRFVRSPMYQNCTLACVEGRPLPDIGPPGPQSKGSQESVTPTSNRKGMEKKESSSESKANRKKRLEKRGSWGADVSYQRATVSRQESQMSVKSTSSVELGFIYSGLENGRNKPGYGSQDLSEAGSGSAQAEKYCCVYLPDNTASLAPSRPGLPIRGMLNGLCEKRGFPLTDVIIYFRGKEKQPLSLDQDSSVLGDQEVVLELRVTLVLEVAFTGKTLGIKVKSSKTLGGALSPVLQKHHLRPQDVVVTMRGSNKPLDINTNVFQLANKKLCLDRAKVPRSTESWDSMSEDTAKVKPRQRKHHEMDGLVEMLSKAQSCRVDDQRGLLTKEHLVLPQFLQLSLEQEQDGKSVEDTEKTLKQTSSPTHAKREDQSQENQNGKRLSVVNPSSDTAQVDTDFLCASPGTY